MKWGNSWSSSPPPKKVAVFQLPQGQVGLSVSDLPQGLCLSHRMTSHPSQHLIPYGAFVLCSVTHGCDGLSDPPPPLPDAASVGCGVYTLWTSSSPLQQTLTQPWNAACLQSEYSPAPEQESFHKISRIFFFSSNSFLGWFQVLINPTCTAMCDAKGHSRTSYKISLHCGTLCSNETGTHWHIVISSLPVTLLFVYVGVFTHFYLWNTHTAAERLLANVTGRMCPEVSDLSQTDFTFTLTYRFPPAVSHTHLPRVRRRTDTGGEECSENKLFKRWRWKISIYSSF